MRQPTFKKRVELSTYCWKITALTTAFICGIFVCCLKVADNDIAVWLWGAAVAVLFLSALCYMPISISISLDSECLNISRPIKSIPLSDIVDARLCHPTMGTKRICGSGGWFGWYGWFSEKDFGKYFAYYGKASDCFLVTLKNGKKYMLGCKDAPEMVNAIKEKINQ